MITTTDNRFLAITASNSTPCPDVNIFGTLTEEEHQWMIDEHGDLIWCVPASRLLPGASHPLNEGNT